MFDTFCNLILLPFHFSFHLVFIPPPLRSMSVKRSILSHRVETHSDTVLSVLETSYAYILTPTFNQRGRYTGHDRTCLVSGHFTAQAANKDGGRSIGIQNRLRCIRHCISRSSRRESNKRRSAGCSSRLSGHHTPSRSIHHLRSLSHHDGRRQLVDKRKCKG